MRRMKYKYCVAIAYLDTNTDYIKVEYIETLSYNAKEAKEDAYSYINRFSKCFSPYTNGSIQRITKEGFPPLF